MGWSRFSDVVGNRVPKKHPAYVVRIDPWIPSYTKIAKTLRAQGLSNGRTRVGRTGAAPFILDYGLTDVGNGQWLWNIEHGAKLLKVAIDLARAEGGGCRAGFASQENGVIRVGNTSDIFEPGEVILSMEQVRGLVVDDLGTWCGEMLWENALDPISPE